MTYSNLLLIGSMVLGLAGIVGLWFLAPKCPRGTIFLISFASLIAGAFLYYSEVHELRKLSRSLQILGVGGLLVSLVDVFRKRKPSFQVDPKDPTPVQAQILTANRPAGALGIALTVLAIILLSFAGIGLLVLLYMVFIVGALNNVRGGTSQVVLVLIAVFSIPLVTAIAGLVLLDVGKRGGKRETR